MAKILGKNSYRCLVDFIIHHNFVCTNQNKSVFLKVEKNMSRSQFKKIAKPVLPVADSDDEYEPPKIFEQIVNPFAGLEISSSSEAEEELAQGPSNVSSTKNTKRERHKKNKQKRKKRRIDSADDIERTVREVNAILGEPSSDVVEPKEPKPDPLKQLFSVKLKCLNVSYECLRFYPYFTIGNVREPFTRPRRLFNQNAKRVLKRNEIIPRDFAFKYCGLSMSIHRVEDNYTYFIFDHSRAYQINHTELIQRHSRRFPDMVTPIAKSLTNMHVEGMLEAVKYFSMAEDYSEAYSTIEKIIAFMIYSAHPYFNLTNIKMRLEYKFMENRPFHIAVLMYLHFLTNKACHCTALDLAKMLLNLDPSDPLAIIFVIDIIAIRAQEFHWLIEAVDFMDKTRDLKYMPNIQFSYALAHYFIANGKEEMRNADRYLKMAMIKFPSGLMGILNSIKHVPDLILRQHEHFNSYASSTTPKPLQDLIWVYAEFIGDYWKEPDVLEWMLRNAHELIDLYENDPFTQNEIAKQEKIRKGLYKRWPDQIYRHLCVIQPFAELLINYDLPEIPNYHRVQIFNPAPPADSINRYDYQSFRTRARPITAIVETFVSSFSPQYDFEPED